MESTLQPLYTRLASHPLYRSFARMEDLQTFMEAHIFAVWDFMSLLKSLQRGLTCVEVPWYPSRTPESRHLVNEIVLVRKVTSTTARTSAISSCIEWPCSIAELRPEQWMR